MPEAKPANGLLSRLPTFDRESGELIAVIETPKGSPNKYDYEDGYGAFRLAGVLPEGTAFPYDFGFIPSTLGGDGDPLDLLVFLDSPAVVGCVLTVRLVGVIEAEQRSQGSEDWVRNDRLLAVATHAHTHEHVKTLDDLRPRLVDEIEQFFAHYNKLKGGEFKPLCHGSPEKAHKLVEEGAALFARKITDARD
jgi:inorganic pyrophosphatase